VSAGRLDFIPYNCAEIYVKLKLFQLTSTGHFAQRSTCVCTTHAKTREPREHKHLFTSSVLLDQGSLKLILKQKTPVLKRTAASETFNQVLTVELVVGQESAHKLTLSLWRRHGFARTNYPVGELEVSLTSLPDQVRLSLCCMLLRQIICNQSFVHPPLFLVFYPRSLKKLRRKSCI
jgi:hypothetical protein